MNHSSQQGIVIILVLVFAAVFGLSVSALTSFIFSQAKLGAGKEVREQALNIAEAGLEYYQWFLTHNPGDTQDGTGGVGPYVRTYSDPETGEIGSFSLDVVGNESCGILQSIDVTSTGTVNSDPKFTRTVFGRHATPSVAEYSYIIGDDVWAGANREITGPYHSNGGIRMDGTNNSVVTSAVSSWSESFNCNGGSASPGVCGDGPNSTLWQYPGSPISFDDMETSFPTIKTAATTDGIYLAPYGSTEINWYGYISAVDGYHLIFNADGTVDIYQVTGTNWTFGYRTGIGYTLDYNTITAESFIERRTIPTDCPVIFVEDKVWIEGTVKGKVTVIAADLVNAGYDPDVIINDDINYSVQDGSDGLTVISEFGIYIPPNSPDNLSINGIFVAQGDRFGRPYYEGDVKTQLTIKGSIISSGRVGTAWLSGSTTVSGYQNRDNIYDRLQTTNPPPFTPSSTLIPEYILWQEL
ncbi:MAG: hypothetical protein CMI56_01405 [Parcubacteria group bacterium]|nr:hypothetical protein [Parcubacteria group bacterium]|tara:strand:+ start:10272 stop:11675 length:1404 start_codon:yes stop_codon:yes gene_type:complete